MVCSAEGRVRAQAGALLWLEERLPAWHQVWALVMKPWGWGGFQEVTLVAAVGWGQGHRCFLIFLGAAVPSHATTTLRK